MAIVVVCSGLVVLGLVLVVVVGRVRPLPRAEGLDDRLATHAPIVARRLAAAAAGGVCAGLLIAGPGGRLVMRLLAVTAGDQAQGRLTEAEQRVGTISVGGTLALMIFGGLFFGVASGFAYLLVRRWLPAGRAGGLAFGGLLLVLAATRLDPLRPGNEDFDLVGPGWLSILAFGALALAHGALVAGMTNWWERRAADADRTRLLDYLPLVVLAPALPILVVVLVGGALAVVLSTQRAAADALASARALAIGRMAIAAAAVVALPFTVTDLADILGRGPG